MGWSVGLEETLRAWLAMVAGLGPGASCMLVSTMVEDSARVAFPETPEEEGEKGMSREVDVSWMAGHTMAHAFVSCALHESILMLSIIVTSVTT